MTRRQRITPPAIEDAQIMWPNFSGKPDKFNREGDRNFAVFLKQDMAEALEAEGWNIKWLDPYEEGDDPQPYMSVSVSYDNIPPKIILITGQGKTLLTEDTVELLDSIDIETADLIINPYQWEVNGKTGIKAYVKSLYITMVEDVFAHKYYGSPDIKASVPSDQLPPSLDIDSDHEY